MAPEVQQNTTKPLIYITPTAIVEVKRLLGLEKEQGLFLRLGVAAGGCSGMSYSMEFDSTAGDQDQTFEYDGLKVVVSQKALPYLGGTTLDYKGGMLGGGFHFENPNARRSCGCGTSFTC